MRKEVQEVLEGAIAGFEKRQQAKQERLREQEWFETGWAQIRTAVVLPALEEVAVLRAALTSSDGGPSSPVRCTPDSW